MKLLAIAALCGTLSLSVAAQADAGVAADDAAPSSGALQPPIARGEGIVSVQSRHTVDDTIARLQALLHAKGVTIFALIDHSGEAAKVGLQMRPTKLLIFGNPRAGTPPMIAAPSLALDLPLKILVWEDPDGKVWLSYNSLEYLRERHGVPTTLTDNLAVVEALAASAGR